MALIPSRCHRPVTTPDCDIGLGDRVPNAAWFYWARGLYDLPRVPRPRRRSPRGVTFYAPPTASVRSLTRERFWATAPFCSHHPLLSPSHWGEEGCHGHRPRTANHVASASGRASPVQTLLIAAGKYQYRCTAYQQYSCHDSGNRIYLGTARIVPFMGTSW